MAAVVAAVAVPLIVKTLVVGSASTCDVRVNGDPWVSGEHVKVMLAADGQVWVEDLGSMNGTFMQRAGRPTPVHPSLLPRVRSAQVWNRGDTLWLSRQTAIPWDD